MSIPDTILGMVRDALPDDVPVYDGQVPEPPPRRYVVVYADHGTRSAAERVDDQSTSATYRWQVTSVAPDRGMAHWLAERVADALTDARPEVEGWVTGEIAHTYSQLAASDDQVLERRVVTAVDQYLLLAERIV